jgi:hypothetical protein
LAAIYHKGTQGYNNQLLKASEFLITVIH